MFKTKTKLINETMLSFAVTTLMLMMFFGYFPSRVASQVVYNELTFSGNIGNLSWASDSQLLALSVENDVHIYSYSLSFVTQLQGHSERITSIDWHPDGTRLATSSADNTVRVWDVDSGSATYGTVLYTLNHSNDVYSVRWSPIASDTRLATTELVGIEQTSDSARSLTVVHIWDITNQLITITLPVQRNGSIAPSWSSNAQWIAYSGLQFSRDYVVSLWDTNTGQLISDFEASIARINEVEWNPQLPVIAYVDDLNSVVVVDISTQGIVTYSDELRSDPDEDGFSIDWKSDGTALVMGGSDNQLRTWYLGTQVIDDNFVEHADDVIQVTWSPNNRYISSISRDNIVRVWDLDGGGTGGGPDQILFSSVTNPFTAATNIFVINPDGSGQTQLTTGTSIKNFPAWSPDGNQIAFASNQDGDDEIFVMNADGSNPVQLTTNTALDRFPVWSPDGTQIAFASRRDGNWEIYVMNADGTNPVNLTNNASDDFNVSWSPDGSQIAFASLRDATISTDTEIYVMNADGTNVQRLTNSPSIDETPNWSPDGSQIAFTSNRNASNIDIYVMNADGTNVQRLTSYSGTDEFPNWSPDGTQIAFDSNRSSFFNLYFDIHRMNADGTNVQRISTRSAFDRFAAWGYP